MLAFCDLESSASSFNITNCDLEDYANKKGKKISARVRADTFIMVPNTVFPSKDDKWSIRIGMESAEEIRNAEIGEKHKGKTHNRQYMVKDSP